MTSTRYALPVALVLMLALIPTVIHGYLSMKINDGLAAENIKPLLAGFTSIATNRQPGWGESTFGCEDWIERTYTDKQGRSLRLFVGRSYDHKRLYHHPELALSYGKDLKGTGQIRLPGQPEIPVNILRNAMRPNFSAAFVLLYDGKFIDNPITHQVQDALKQLVSARKPMTLFYLANDATPDGVAFTKTPDASLLESAIKDFIGQAPASPKE